MTPRPLSVLILGGYGSFGGRLARLLADESGLALFIAGRSLEKAADFCRSLPFKAAAVPCRFDRDGDLDVQLRAIAPRLVVDATGPFPQRRCRRVRSGRPLPLSRRDRPSADRADHSLSRLAGAAR